MNNFSTGHEVVDAVGQMHFEGNIIPHTWYQTLRLKTGKPDMVAMILLSEFVYWYRPTFKRDEQTGQLIGAQKKFHADLLQKSYPDLAEQFGFSAKQIREALIRLEEKGVLERVFRTVKTKKGKIPNVMFIKLHVSPLVKICFPTGKDLFPQKETPISPQGKTNTEITSEITSDNLGSSSSKGKPVNNAVIMDFWDSNGFGHNNINAKQDLLKYLDDGFTHEAILKALVIAGENNVCTLKYVKGILLKWENKGAKTLEQVEAVLAEYENNKKKGGKTSGSTKTDNGKSNESKPSANRFSL